MLENYEPVSVRLHRLLTTLRAEGKDPRVITVMLSAPGTDVCVFRAELWLGDHLMATGHAEEVRGQGNVNRTSHVENCETSALGRMCESYSPNADPTKRPSREEMGKVTRTAGAPRSTSASGAGGIPSGTGDASPAQLGKIRAMSKSLGKLPPANLDGMSKREASAVIEQLIAESQAANGEDPF